MKTQSSDTRPEAEIQLGFITLHYGQEIAARLRTTLTKKVKPMDIPDILEVMTPIVSAFEQLAVGDLLERALVDAGLAPEPPVE